MKLKEIFHRANKAITVIAIGCVIFTACKKDRDQEPEQEAPIRPITADSKAYVSELINYMPAPGQFVNTSVANMAAAQSIVGSKNNIVSLGAWGGSITLKFDHTVLNRTGEKDIIIYGNAFAGFAEPGVIWVMEDKNGNGKADDTWYALSGSETGKAGFDSDYAVTYTRPDTATKDVPWKDNRGKSGVIAINAFHKQAYYPEWVKENTYTLKGILLPSSNIDATNPLSITSTQFDFGYADNTAGGDKVDIADAIDKSGNKINLKGIDFVKIQTGILYNMGWLGEQSTEVAGVADLSILK